MEDYKVIEFGAGCDITGAVVKLQREDVRTKGMFNGKWLYSDKDTVDSAFRKVTGKSYYEFKKTEKERQAAYKKEQKEHEEKIPSLINVWKSNARGVIRDDKLDYWDKIVPIRLGDLYHGMELDCTIRIADIINEGGSIDEVKEELNNQGHSGMSYGLVRGMIKEFCYNGEEIAEQL